MAIILKNNPECKEYKFLDLNVCEKLKMARNLYIACKRDSNPAYKYWGEECLKLRKELEA